ncbi:MAG: hypothetical protein JXA69_00725 [Phycisphaerae bacterium]|nr:hypothetical protein [Phycisphaerae bacterium]
MTSKQRMQVAMARAIPDRVPVMCQLALGHYFLHAGLDPFDVWFTSDGFAEALIRLRERYRFDGILVNLPGRPPDISRYVDRIERGETEDRVFWLNGGAARLPHDDNAHYVRAAEQRPVPPFAEIEPDALFYVEPWDATGVNYPFTWDFEREPRPESDFFPSYCTATIEAVLARVGETISVHSELFSPFSQLLELLGYEAALVALLDDPAKAHACLERLTVGAIELGRRQARCGVDAVLISSAFAGAGFISREHYAEFVLPYERQLTAAIRAEGWHGQAARGLAPFCPDRDGTAGAGPESQQTLRQRADASGKKVPDPLSSAAPPLYIYTHTCGAIGDRLDLMLDTGTDGIDTLDPPPLGTVELDKAKPQLAGKAFIKGNIDAVNTLLEGTNEHFTQDVRWRLEVGKPGGGYILSSACSVAPHVKPARLEQLVTLAEELGRYD